MRDHNGVIRRFAGLSDKNATEALGQQIQRLISYKVADLPPDPQMTRWIEGLPEKLRRRLAEVGILDASRLAATKSLEENLEDFEKSGVLRGKEKNIQENLSMLRKIIEGCKFRFWSDVKASDIEVYLAGRREKGLSKKTVENYAKAFRRFSKWLLNEKRITEVPVIHYGKAPKNYGRAFELDDFQKLLEATLSGPERKGLSGRVRYVLYMLAAQTGLRRGELRALTVSSFNFKNNTLFVGGEHTKNGEDAVQEFSAKMAGLLKELVAGKLPGVQLFAVPENSAEMIQCDCRAAGIEVAGHTGHSLNFHSLRHTCGSFLAASNVHPKIIQGILRHKDINLTMSRYVHILKGQRRSAIESMPDFTERRKTGTV